MITFTICCVFALLFAIFEPMLYLMELLFCGVAYVLWGAFSALICVAGWLIDTWLEAPRWARIVPVVITAVLIWGVVR